VTRFYTFIDGLRDSERPLGQTPRPIADDDLLWFEIRACRAYGRCQAPTIDSRAGTITLREGWFDAEQLRRAGLLVAA
jgi:hypothetical protein